jgi:hypothetical protein
MTAESNLHRRLSPALLDTRPFSLSLKARFVVNTGFIGALILSDRDGHVYTNGGTEIYTNT